MAQVGDAPGNEELQRARAESHQHDVGRAVVVVGVAELRHLTGGGPGGIGLQRQVGIFVELELVPRFAVVGRDEDAEDGEGEQDKPFLGNCAWGDFTSSSGLCPNPGYWRANL